MRLFIGLIISFVLTSCNFKGNKYLNEIPEVQDLENFKQTEFVTTLESPISTNKNTIYVPTFLYAWDEVKEKLKSEIIVGDSNSINFKLLNLSESQNNSLAKGEYSTSTETAGGVITAKAFLKIALPFETKLQDLEDSIIWSQTKVSAFGMYYYDENTVKFTTILYYKNDNKFILRLRPNDHLHEILLIKGVDNYKNLSEALKLTFKLIEKGKSENNMNELAWKYQIAENDIFSIPKIKFNIQCNFSDIEGQTFFTKDRKHHFIETAYQRTGFVLNENGAAVESEAYILTDSIGEEQALVKPKKMIFDKPFLVVVKKIKQENPLIVVRICNTELLTKK